MRKLTSRDLKILTLLSIVVPVGLLTTFRLAGILEEPSSPRSPETITAASVSWELERPSGHVDINERVENNYTNHDMSAGIGLFICTYEENSHSIPFAYGSGGRDGLTIRPYVNLTFTQGFIESFSLKFHLLDTNASVFVHSESPPLEEYNATVTDIEWYAENLGTSFVEAQALRSPCGLETQFYWILDDKNDQAHQLEIALEVLYSTTTTYQKITVPIMLAVLIQSA